MEKKIIVIPKGKFCWECEFLADEYYEECKVFSCYLRYEKSNVLKCSACLNKTPIEIKYEEE